MAIRTFALTYPQLMNQAIAQGLDEKALGRLRDAYEFAETWFHGFYRGQGMPFISHLVRTASIVLAERQPIEVVMAALLHASYMRGLFRNSAPERPTHKLRIHIAQAVGSDVEEIIWGYQQLSWYSAKALNQHLEKLNTYDSRMRHLLIMRLANELEDYLDLAMVYRGNNPFRETLEACGRQTIDLARQLDLSQLAEELEVSFKAHLKSQLPEVVFRNHENAYRLRDRDGGISILAEQAVSKTGRLLERAKQKISVRVGGQRHA